MKTTAQGVQEQMLPFDAFLAPGASPMPFEPNGLEAMSDVDLLAIVLRDRLAPALILHEFASIGEAASATTADFILRTGLDQDAHAMLQAGRELAARLAKQPLVKRQVLTSWDALISYLRIRAANEQREQVRILYLDKRNQLIRDEIAGTGTVDHAPVYVREVMHRALNLGASAIIMTHNHPSGDPTASQGDIAMTKALVDAGKVLNIAVHDHVVVGRDGIYSFRQKGLI